MERGGAENQPEAIRRSAGRHRGCHVSSLGPHPRHKNGQISDHGPNLGELGGIGGPDDQAAVPAPSPTTCHHLSQADAQRPSLTVEGLQVVATRVARAAYGEHTTAMREEWLDRIGTEVRVNGDRVGAVAIESFPGVMLGGGVDVSTFGIEDQCDVWVGLPDVGAQLFELRLGALRSEKGDLWLERTNQVGGCIDDRNTEPPQCITPDAELTRDAGRLGVDSDAQQ